MTSHFSDKATSTDDIPPNFPDIDDALSQLSYNSAMFDDMLKRSAADPLCVSMTTSTGAQEVRCCYFI